MSRGARQQRASVTNDCNGGTITPERLLAMFLCIIAAQARDIEQLKQELNAMSSQSQALLAKVGEVEAQSGSLIGLAQALKAAADAGAASVAALAAEQAAHAETNAEVDAAAVRLETVRAAEAQAVTENTPS